MGGNEGRAGRVAITNENLICKKRFFLKDAQERGYLHAWSFSALKLRQGSPIKGGHDGQGTTRGSNRVLRL